MACKTEGKKVASKSGVVVTAGSGRQYLMVITPFQSPFSGLAPNVCRVEPQLPAEQGQVCPEPAISEPSGTADLKTTSVCRGKVSY